jgi:phosphatidylserine/phosphatidylglycerophosphate/cardiolipin synthase-like enzyme
MRNRDFSHSHYLKLISLFVMVLFACVVPTAGVPTESQAPVVTEADPAVTKPSPIDVNQAAQVGKWLQVYFTNPFGPHARDYEGGPDEYLAAAIDKARLSVDVAAYNLNLWSIEDALIHAHQRGVKVRIVMESDNMDNSEVQDIKKAGIKIVGDVHEGLMHNKFVVIDQTEVWTGSMNYSVGGAYKDNNNLIRIENEEAALAYIEEFNQMFTDRMFGEDRTINYSKPTVLNIDETEVEIYFSPEDKAARRIVELIDAAKQSIVFMMYTLTSDEIGAAIISQAQAGLVVAGVMDSDQIKSSQGTEYDAFMQAGINVRLDGNETGLMHHKVMIIDQNIVITGSYNFTASAEERNDENLVIIHSPATAAKYYEEFERVHDRAQAPQEQPTDDTTSEPQNN